MPLLVCCGCGHSSRLAKIPRRARCSNCGSRAARRYTRIKVWMNDTKRTVLEPQRAREATLAGLLWLADAWHYRPQWASVKYHKIFGDWPLSPYPKPVMPPLASMPGGELTHWALKEKAAYARQKRTRAATRDNRAPEQGGGG